MVKMQVILLVILEGLVFISIIVLKPYDTRKADILAGYLAIVRLVCAGLMIAFLPSLAVKAIIRVVIGIVTAVIFSVAVVVMFFNTVWNILQPLFSRKNRTPSPTDSSDSSALEKGTRLLPLTRSERNASPFHPPSIPAPIFILSPSRRTTFNFIRLTLYPTLQIIKAVLTPPTFAHISLFPSPGRSF
jgi:hypothetical protein